MANRRYNDWDDDGMDDDLGHSYDSVGMSPSVTRYMYNRQGDNAHPDTDEDIIDRVLAQVMDLLGDNFEKWKMDELSDIVRRFEYNSEKVADYLLQQLDKSKDTKTSDDMFDFDEEQGGGMKGPSTTKGAHSTLAAHLQGLEIESAGIGVLQAAPQTTSAREPNHMSNDLAQLHKFLQPELPSDVVRFAFNEPSPDDLVLSQQKTAFTRGGAASAAAGAKSTTSAASPSSSNIVPSITAPGSGSSSQTTTTTAKASTAKGPIVVGGAKKGPIVAGGKKTAHVPVAGGQRPAGTPPKATGGTPKGPSKPNLDQSLSGVRVDPSKAVSTPASPAHHTNGHPSNPSTPQPHGAGPNHKDNLNHELLQPMLIPTPSGLSSSSELGRSGSKSKMVKQMADPKREKVLKELLAEATTAGQSAANKSHLNMVVIGHVDSGKSTTMGHLLFQLGLVEKKTIDKFEHECKTIGKQSFHFAWVMDEQEEERSRGVTIDVAVQHFETERHKVTILDAPGHQDFVPNMISGAAQADVAVLVVNASDAEFATILEMGQAKEHIVLARSLGVGQIIVGVNKLDTCNWKQERFEFVRELLLPFLKKSGFKENVIQFIPISGLTGENLVKRSETALTSWFSGLTLIDAINAFAPAKRDLEKPFRLSINDIFRDPHVLGLTVAGKVESGFVTVGDKLALVPPGGSVIATVKGIRVGTALVERASAGQNAELGITDVEEKNLSLGDVLCDPMAPVPLVQKFQAQLVTFDLEAPILRGTNVDFFAANLNEAASITKLVGILDASGAIKQKNPRALVSRVTAMVEITLRRKIPAELYKEYRGLGRFTVRVAGKTVAAGILTSLNESISVFTATPPPASHTASSSS